MASQNKHSNGKADATKQCSGRRHSAVPASRALTARKPPAVPVREQRNIPECVNRKTAAHSTLSQGILHLTFGK